MTRCPECGGLGGTHAGSCRVRWTPEERLDNLGADYLGYRRDAERARLALVSAIVDAAAAGVTEVDIARFAGVDRMTVRKALGKR